MSSYKIQKMLEDIGSGAVGQYIAIIIGIIVLITIIKFFRWKDKEIIALVLKKFELNEDLNNKSVSLVLIEGRKAGIISWLLTLVGISATTSLEANSEQLIFKQQSLYGETNNFIPLPAVAELTGGYTRKFNYLILCIFFLAGGLISAPFTAFIGLIAGIILAVIFGILFWLSKRLEIIVGTNGGTHPGIAFKRSIIGNLAVDIDKVKKTITVINQAILNVNKKAE